MNFYEELDRIDMEIDYELNKEEEVKLELIKMNNKIMDKLIHKELNG